MVGVAKLLPFFAAFWFFVAAAVFVYKARGFPRKIRPLYPITAYLLGIGLFFVFQGYGDITSYSCPGSLSCTDLGGGLVVMVAASFIARFPLKSEFPRYADAVFAGLVVVSVVIQAFLALNRPDLLVTVANLFAFVVAGVGTVGYLGYRGLVADDPFELKVGLAIAPCCVIAHGTAGLGLVAVISLPLVGIPLATPYLFAILAPIAVIAVLAFFAQLDGQLDGQLGDTPASAGVAVSPGIEKTVPQETPQPTDSSTKSASSSPAGGGEALPDEWPPTRDAGTVRECIAAVKSLSDEEFDGVFGPYLDELADPQPDAAHDSVEFVFLGLELDRTADPPQVVDTTPVRYVVVVGGRYRFAGDPDPENVDLELHLPPGPVEDVEPPRPPDPEEVSPPPTDPEGKLGQSQMLQMHKQMHAIEDAEAEHHKLMQEHRKSMQAMRQGLNPEPMTAAHSWEKNMGQRLDAIEKKLDKLIENQNAQKQ
jgi:hypothetical protein